ncbi:MAG: glycine--tRNA ligase, partial [Planctomycetes bacterium]|nr:glycine--tRNA ligase [Planctomycetota bacterium]
VYLRPETAQAMFVQFENVRQATSMKVPFGIAQMGKSFRNEVTVEHFIFRSCEFEQMEIEYFVEPGTQTRWLEYWKEERLGWYRGYANRPDDFRLRRHRDDERAHYADDCYDIEYRYPWGWDELEGVASRTDYDLKKHSEYAGKAITYFDPQKPDPATGKPGFRYTPYVIEPSAGATRSTLVFLLDAYAEEKGVDAKGAEKVRTLLRLHPRLAPIKVAVLPLVRKDGLPEIARDVVRRFFAAGVNARYDEQHSIGRRYSRHDEVGTPYCLTIDGQTKQDETVTIRDRDTTEQSRIRIDEALDVVRKRLGV